MENNQHHRFYDILSDYSNYFYKHKDNDKLEAEYILNENKYNSIKHKLKKAGLKFLNNMWYSKFWATILDPLKNVVRKKNKSLFNTQYL